MYLLRNGVKHYEWGSTDAIPQFLGHLGDGQPVAEVWIGTHPLSPSSVVDDNGAIKPLADVAGDLPFMLKVLAAERPLSLQVHPSRPLAEIGFAREEEAGIPLDAPERVYKDANHKPEMVYALSTFDSLIGFRPSAEILRVLGPVNTPLTHRLSDRLRSDPGFASIVRLIEELLNGDVSPGEVHQVVGACRALSAMDLDVKRAYQTAIEISGYFPDDVGVVVSLLLNRVTLQPGEAAYLETGVIHAHLKGLCLEVMATSDNVLRAGLTDKHVDTKGLVACLERGMARVSRVTSNPVGYDTEVFSPGEGVFALAVTQVSSAAPDGVELVRADRSVVICTGGEVRVTTPGGSRATLRRGESAYLGPDDAGAKAHGLGEIAQAHVPSQRSLRSRLISVV